MSALDDLRSADSLLALTLSNNLAQRQRTDLVGHSITSPADLASLAQLYRDPRFETFRVFFVNHAKKVVSQIGVTSRLPTATATGVGEDMDAYVPEGRRLDPPGPIPADGIDWRQLPATDEAQRARQRWNCVRLFWAAT